ncbi:TetR/AcrR family transcriptional regulator [Salinibacterium sp. SWN1162]|uniref:TetR/AcrR family transcriptional regulator n=1 Tax=Salinibacterium sp. SWN1162 TaxID=2792053 RepID=UPI0018CE8FC9|nr:TetR/AcrR family transcriptional regulator [Salinibacterium sp. SWN1162]MBH0008803.1 TetR/AcrR family transcriptional regulator [Salinibacterium sp. SWN1162]
MSSQQELQRIALAEFAIAGYTGTSIQRIAELAGLSKSSVLYHFTSKEALLEAAAGPAVGRLDELVSRLETNGINAEYRAAFIESFVDFIFDCRQEVHLFINQGPSLVGLAVIDRANDTVRRLVECFEALTSNPRDKMRFGIALGGSAYMLCTADNLAMPIESDEETRRALVEIMSELLAPVRAD